MRASTASSSSTGETSRRRIRSAASTSDRRTSAAARGARLGEAGVECFEADRRFAYRYLIDRGVKGGFRVDGPFERRPGVGRVYRNPGLEPADFAPRLRVLSLDVETSPDASRLYSIAVAGAGGERVLLVGPSAVAGADVVPDERALLGEF